MKGKKDTKEDRMYPYRSHELSATDSNESQNSTDEMVNYNITIDNTSDENIEDAIEIKKEDENEELEAFNKLCGDYQVRYNHTRTLRSTINNSDDNEVTAISPKKRNRSESGEIPAPKKEKLDIEIVRDDFNNQPSAGLKASMKMMGRDSLERLANYDSPGPSSRTIKKTRVMLAELSRETLDSLATTLTESEEDSELDEKGVKEKFDSKDIPDLEKMEAKLEKKADKNRQKLREKMKRQFQKVKTSDRADELTTIKTKLRILKEVKEDKKEKLLAETKRDLQKMKREGIFARMRNTLKEAELKKAANGIKKDSGKKITIKSKCDRLLRQKINTLIARYYRLSHPEIPQGRPGRRRRGRRQRRRHLPPRRRRRSIRRKYSMICVQTLDEEFKSSDSFFNPNISEDYKCKRCSWNNNFNDLFKKAITKLSYDGLSTSDTIVLSIDFLWSDLITQANTRILDINSMFQAKDDKCDRTTDSFYAGKVQGDEKTDAEEGHRHTAAAPDAQPVTPMTHAYHYPPHALHRTPRPFPGCSHSR